MEWIWSYILTIVGLVGFILAGRRVWWCWYINIFAQILWFIYAITTQQYGFLIASIVYTFVFADNARKWTRAHNRKRRNNPKHLYTKKNEDDDE